MLFFEIPADVQTKILSFCSIGDLLTLRRTPVLGVSVVLDCEFRLRVPSQRLKGGCSMEDVRAYVHLLHHSLDNSRPLICKTAGCKLFRLRAKDVDGLNRTFKRNWRYANADDMELFSRVDLFVAAMKRHGSVAKLQEYDAKLKRRASIQLVKKKAVYEQTLVQREEYLDRNDKVYKAYLVDVYGKQQSYQADEGYREFRIKNQDEYRVAYGNDFKEYDRFQNAIDYRNRASESNHEAKADRESTHTSKRVKTTRTSGDTRKSSSGLKRFCFNDALVCVTCRDRAAARKCTTLSCGICCGLLALRECSRHRTYLHPTTLNH